MSVAVAPETLIDAATFDDAPAARSENVDEEKLAAFMERSKVTATLVLVETPVAPEAGERLMMTGGVGAEAVVNIHDESLPKAMPLVSVTLPETKTV